MSVTTNHVTLYQNTISNLRGSVGRNVVIYMTPVKVDCVWCVKDPVSGRSSGIASAGYVWSTHIDYVAPLNTKVCPNCGGAGDTLTDVTHTVLCTKKSLDYNDRDDSGVATYRPGSVRIACNLSSVLTVPADVNSPTYFDTAIKVIFDGSTYDVINTSKWGLRELFTCSVILEKR